jgi:hypothetical protein
VKQRLLFWLFHHDWEASRRKKVQTVRLFKVDETWKL